jgi:hypothetical protein
VLQNLKELDFAPSVQMQQVPPDFFLLDETKAEEDPDVRMSRTYSFAFPVLSLFSLLLTFCCPFCNTEKELDKLVVKPVRLFSFPLSFFFIDSLPPSSFFFFALLLFLPVFRTKYMAMRKIKMWT